MTEEQYLMEQIHLIRLEYEKVAKPYVDRLVYLKSIELPPPILISKEHWEAIAKAQA